jgi:hypothetical protein
LIAKKILRTHMKEADDHAIEEIVENMASKLYFHGHPINRVEAKTDLHLKVKIELPKELEEAIWNLYLDYEVEFENLSVFNPPGDLAAMPPPGAIPPTGITPPAGIALQPGIIPSPGTTPQQKEYCLLHAMVESAQLSSRHTTRRRFTLVQIGPQKAVQEDILSQGWSHSSVPEEGSQHQPSPT